MGRDLIAPLSCHRAPSRRLFYSVSLQCFLRWPFPVPTQLALGGRIVTVQDRGLCDGSDALQRAASSQQ